MQKVKSLIQRFKYYIAGLILLIFYTAFIYLFIKPKDVIVYRDKIVEVPAKEIVKTVEIPVKKITVFKKGISNEIVLPKNLITLPSDYIVASSEVKSDSTYNHNITTFVDADTGKFTTYDVKEPLPWVAFNKKGSFGSSLGMKNNVLTSRTEVVGEFMQVKEVHLGIIVGYDKPVFDKTIGADTYIGVGGWINF